MSEIDAETLQIAREEAGDCLARIESNLLAIESGGDNPQLVDALFRDAHSVKGAASMVGWREVASIAHGMEDRLELARERGDLAAEEVGPLLQETDELRRAVEAASKPPPEPATTPVQPPRPATMRVDPARVDSVLDAVGETMLHRRRLEHIAGERIAAAGDEAEEELDRGERLLGELQDAVLAMRTMPLASIVGPFPRAVRDIAEGAGKEAELAVGGTETQLDRVILEGIADPITHLLRNAVAHGLESPEERVAAGKPRRGRVDLRAEQRGGMVAIEVADDGRGVSPQLLERAEESGSLLDVLATAGLSTAAEVGDLAGRGVGLDAVKSHIEALGGSIEMRSEPGRGTEVVLLLPVTLALLNVLLCERGGQPFGLPVPTVRELVTVSETSSLEGKVRIEHRGEVLLLADLAALLGAQAPPLGPQPTAIVVGSTTRAVAVACDRVVGDRELVVKSLGPVFAGIEGYLGAGILEDGRVALILDPNRLLDSASAPAIGPTEVPRGEEAAAPKILVVDDQFSVRQLQRSILEAAGYRVDVARHGREALQKLAADAEFELVLTDVQMPEMDGIELLREIRGDADRQDLAVAIVTSKGSEEDRRRGVEEGADAYIVKEEFNQQALLETIERLIGG